MNTLEETQSLPYLLLKKMIKKKRLTHAYLFEGKNKTDIEASSIYLFQSLFCSSKIEGLPCEQCTDCKRVSTFQHPDISVVEPDGKMIKVDAIRSLIQEMSKTSMEGGYQAILVRKADSMNDGAANALLKYLEEPLGDTLILLQTENSSSILPTILSRTQVLHFPKLNSKQLEEAMIGEGINVSLANDLSQLVETVEEGKSLSEQESFLELRQAVKKWKQLVDKQNESSFVFLTHTLFKIINHKKNSDEEKKELQRLTFELFLLYFEEDVREIGADGQALTFISKARERVEKNVTFQSSLEALTLQLLER